MASLVAFFSVINNMLGGLSCAKCSDKNDRAKLFSVKIALFIVFFIRSGEKTPGSGEKKVKSREKIISLLLQDGSLSAASLAGHIGITAKAVEKQLARLKAEGLIRRVGPDKGGYWQVLKEP